MPFKKIAATITFCLAVFLTPVLITKAATCTGPFFGGTGFCYATGSTGGIQAGFIPFGNGTSGFATSSNLYWDNTNSKLGISTSSPTNALGVTGYIDVSGQVGGYKFNGNKFIYASSTNFATVMGIGAGTNLDATSTIQGNTAIGYQALNTAPANSSQPIHANTAVGYQALQLNSTGNNNAAFGYQACSSNVSNSNNTCIGYQAGKANTANSNTFIGLQVGVTHSTGNQNTAVGTFAFNAASNVGANNSAFGVSAGAGITSGSTNTLIGWSAAKALTTGSFNIALGIGGEFPSNSASGQLNIGNVIWGSGLYNSTSFQSSTSTLNGMIGIGSTTPTAQLAIHGVNGSTNTTLFAVASSTSSATTTLLAIKNTGNLILAAITYVGAVVGDFWFDATQNMLAYYNGNTLYIGGNFYAATANQTINSSVSTSALSSTKIGTTVISASSLKVGQRFTIWGAGYYSTPLGNTDTVTITTSIASSTVTTISTVTTAAFPASATNLPFDFSLNCTVRTVGASGTLACDGEFRYATAVSGVAKTTNSISTIGTITFDSTVAETLNVKANWSAAAGGQTATVQESWIDF